ncbi:MAG: flavodoxin-dependent (E)-4-hydroxy-3-methylbut-2-enyl-diphosphate synthase [Candidatus Omnitrophota bacterium]
MIERRKTRTVDIGGVKIGAGYPVAIQSMAKTVTADINATVGEIIRLEKAGCEIVRVAVKSTEDARAISGIKEKIHIPLIADIHFDHRLALESIRYGADKIRINPGNMGRTDDVERIIDAAAAKKIPVRIGINSGSLKDITTSRLSPPDAMVSALSGYLDLFRRRGFDNIVISLKSSDVASTVMAYRKMAGSCDYPFHIGITAAGLPSNGIVKSSMGIGALLMDGIGDTIRVSLTGDPVCEVDVARRILSAAGSRSFGPEIIACPTCGRCQVDLVSIAGELERKIKSFKLQASSFKVIAVMGCEVNGPGEAKAADIGIAFGKGKGAIFRAGKIIKTVAASAAVDELLRMIDE